MAPGATVDRDQPPVRRRQAGRVLDDYASRLGIELFDLLIDWGWFWFFTKPMFYLIDWFYHVFGNFGVAILLVTVIVKALFFPLANNSYRR